MGQEWEDVLIKEKILTAALLVFLALSISLGGAAAWFKLQRDNARLKLSEYQLQVENAAKAQEIRVQVMREQSERIMQEREDTYAESIKQMQGAIDAIQTKYSGTLGENVRLVHLNAGLLDAADSTRRALSGLLQAASIPTDTERDSDKRLADANRYITVLTAACVQTDTDYKALRKAWDDECAIKGCE